MANEEIKVHFGASTEAFDNALAGVKKGSREAGDLAHGSFVHASNGAKQFHRVLHEITAQSPIMGGALQLAMSPVAGAFALLGVGVTFVTEKLKAWNTEWDRMGAEAAKPTRDVKEAMRESRKAIEETRREYEKFLKTLEPDAASKARAGLEDSIALLNQKSRAAIEGAKASGNPDEAARLEKRRLELEFLMRRSALRASSDAQLKLADRMDAAAAAKEKAEADAKFRIDNANHANEDEQKNLKRIQDELAKERELQTDIDLDGNYPEREHDIEVQRKKIRELEAEERGSKTRTEMNKSVIDRENRAREAAADRLTELNQQYTRQHALFEELSNQLEQSRMNLAAYKSPVDPRNAPTKATDEAVTALRQKTSDWLAGQQAKLNEWNIAQGIGPAAMKDALGNVHRPQPQQGVEAMLSKISDNIDALLRVSTSQGLIVRAKD